MDAGSIEENDNPRTEVDAKYTLGPPNEKTLIESFRELDWCV